MGTFPVVITQPRATLLFTSKTQANQGTLFQEATIEAGGGEGGQLSVFLLSGSTVVAISAHGLPIARLVPPLGIVRPSKEGCCPAGRN